MLWDQLNECLCLKKTTKIISEFNNETVRLRSCQISKQIESVTNTYEKEKLQSRLSRLNGQVALINLGAVTDSEMKHKKLLFEDAIYATKAAIDEGVVPGGGAALLHLAGQLDAWASKNLSQDELVGAQVVSRALSEPLIMIVNNAGLGGKIIAERIKMTDFAMGYDANTDTIVDMYQAGIIDPAKVTRLALQNAVSIASAILTTECIIGDFLAKTHL